ncbi:MAG: FtsW/RodA/SpoVE family cell cycle protein [Bacilli bacterium]|nr:FtsW/RodA/SpoVE family cell cycle protein [Bacilli bacterium]
MKKVIKNIDYPLLIVSAILFAIGLIMVFSSSNVIAYMAQAASPYNYFLKQAGFLVIGLALGIFIICRTTKFYGIASWFLLLLIGASLVLLLAIGQAKNQAVSWFDLGPINFQPSEFIKIVYIVWAASFYELNKKGLDSYSKVLFPVFVGLGIAFLIMLQPDLGTAIIFITIVGMIFLAVPTPKVLKGKIIFAAVGLLMVLAIFLLASGKSVIQKRQLERFDFKRPCDKLLTTGNQVCNGYIAINNGGLTGLGLGNSTQKYLYLPEPYTDFIFAVIVEELGAIVGIAILLMYMFVLYRILAIGRKAPTLRDGLMCYGIAVYIFMHIAVNLLGLFGLMPMTGVPLPFMSYGGSYTVCLMVSLVIVERVAVETKLSRKKKNS